jgi:hypothetical protein
MTKWIIREAKALFLVTLYFLFCYGTIIIIKKLILAHYNISYFGFGAAILGALISAKTVLIIESTPLGKTFHSRLPILKIIFDCLLYTALALILLYVEKVIELGYKEGNYRLAFATVDHDDDLSGFFAMVLWAAISFLGYAVFSAISRHLGPGELYRLFFTAPHPKSEVSSKT